MKPRVFVDTSAWVALAYAGEVAHPAARDYYQRASQWGVVWVTSDYILDETLTLLRTRFGYIWAERFWNLVRQALETGHMQLLQVDSDAWQTALRIFFQYQDQDFSFTDCTSFALMRREGIETAFAFDHHFWVMGFQVEPPAQV
ncbi:MAG: PIN domain-containing protein [Fimbriimonadales bacterium]|nr:PIN domain-containing protein [Fimbriimonadales bacterium]